MGLQAAALDRGSLVVVQSLTATSLVIAFPRGRSPTSRSTAGGARLAMVVGIVLFLSVGPRRGDVHPDAAAWWWAGMLSRRR